MVIDGLYQQRNIHLVNQPLSAQPKFSSEPLLSQIIVDYNYIPFRCYLKVMVLKVIKFACIV